MTASERDKAAEWFRRFANGEGRESPRYREWALGIAEDATILGKIVRLPVAKRQPVLILTCARRAGVRLMPFASVREEFLTLWPAISTLAKSRSTQTNDPRRCTPLLVALRNVRGPISLIEIGASAGLTLMPDQYSYRWTAPGRQIVADPKTGPSAVVLSAEITGWGANPPVIPQVVYREGIDLKPLAVSDPADREWLEALVWPEQTERLQLVRAAAVIVSEAKPRLTPGDALDEIRAAVARARQAAPRSTVVIWSPAVLVYLDPQRREEFAAYCRRSKVLWVSLDGRRVLNGLDKSASEKGLNGEFLLTVDGVPIAEADPLGREVRVLNGFSLSPDDLDLLEFERIHWGTARSKESLVRTHWKLTLVRYYQRLYAIMESAAATRYDPVLVRAFENAQNKRGSRQT